jgi:hypothetical protein
MLLFWNFHIDLISLLSGYVNVIKSRKWLKGREPKEMAHELKMFIYKFDEYMS